MNALTAPDNQNRPPVTVNSKGLFTCRTNEWATPQTLFDALREEFDFDLDVAARLSNTKCEKFFTKKQNGLSQDWYRASKTKHIYCNPPFQGQTAKWVEKAYQESLKGCTVVVLIPFRSDTAYIHDYVIGKASEIRLIKGRLKYNDGDGSAPFPSCIIVFRPHDHHTKWLSVDKENNELSGVISFKPDITFNTNRTYKSGKKAPDGIELRFGSVRPTAEWREKLKEYGFQFSEKQKIWYALDNAKSRELITYLETNDLEADDTQYEKRHFWTSIRSMGFYNQLTQYTEFMVSGNPPQFYRNKKQLESRGNVQALIYSDQLKFKKFYNKIIGEGEEGSEESESQESENEETENENTENETNEETEQQKPNPVLAQKLKTLADGMQAQINSKINSATSRQRPTAKRLRVAAGMREDGYHLQNIQQLLYALSNAHAKGMGKEFYLLKNIQSKSQAELINKYTNAQGIHQENHYLQSVFDHQQPNFRALGIRSVYEWSLANGQRFELLEKFSDRAVQQITQKQRQIEELEIKIKSRKIDGFFPTPKKLIDELIGIAEIKKGESILEPSAGKGDILDVIKQQFADTVTLSACEVNSDLRELLTLKGYELVGRDFLELNQTFDKIIMNPPFENGQDIDHVLHAFSLLNKGGRLVAIMSEGVFFRNFKKEKDFRNTLFHTNAFISDKIQGAFKDAFNQTGVAVRIVAINQDGSLPEPEEMEDFEEEDMEEQENDTDSQETNESDENNEAIKKMELEALAELEMLKMELELKEKQKKSRGLSGHDESDSYPAVWDIH